jgi:proteasome lid subunit RPN8/RPN11
MSLVLRLTASHWASITSYLTTHLPQEACGLLAGAGGEVQHLYLITNAEHSPTRYRMDSAELLNALNEMDERGWELISIFHSHPAGPPVPSPTDIAEAYYPDSAYLICSPAASGQWQGRAFEIRNGQAREIGLEIRARHLP